MKTLGSLIAVVALALLMPPAGWSQNKIYTNISNETLEKILQGLELKFQKVERKEKEASLTIYDFKRGDQPYRLNNYGSDLWIECQFDDKLKLEGVNRWNAEAKFSRAVLIDQKEKTMFSLESQMDCLGGVTDAMVKQFINRFDEETKRFVKSMPK